MMGLRRRRTIAATVAVALVAIVAVAFVLPERRDSTIADTSGIRAVHYWGSTYPVTFWNALDPTQIDRDFTRIRGDGFNAIVLAVSWPEFQPRLSAPTAFDDQAFGLLTTLIAKARAHGLDVVLRLGFVWSYRPDAELPNGRRVDAAFVDDAPRDAWLRFVGEVCRRVCDEANVRFAFLTWEDLYPFKIASDSPELDTPGFRNKFIEYLRTHRDLDHVSRFYGMPFASWDDVPLPSRKSAAYEFVLAYWDDALVNRFFLPAREHFPRLSFEARVDWDPVWRNGIVDWYRHDALAAAAGAEVATLYYSVALGMRNDGDRIGAAEALAQLDRLLTATGRLGSRSGLFIDQFNFFDDTPEFSRNTRLEETAMDAMLVGSAAVLRRHRAGFALWTDHDYVVNMLYNPGFHRGLAGWTASGGAKSVVAVAGRVRIALPPRASITQWIDTVESARPYLIPGARGTVCVKARAAGGSVAELRLEVLDKTVSLNVADKVERRCAEVRLAPALRFAVSAAETAVELDEVELYIDIQHSRIYSTDGTPGPQLEAIRTLNRDLARGETP
jgi:hypothetical protein